MVLVNETIRLFFAITALVLAAMLTAPIDEPAVQHSDKAQVQQTTKKVVSKTVVKKSKKSPRA